MGTQKPLAQMIPEIIEHVNKYQDHMQYNLRIFKILQGQVRKEVEESLRREMVSNAAYARAVQRIPSINILRKASQKLSKVYEEPALRTTSDKIDQEIMDGIVKESMLDSQLMEANIILNAQRMAAIEPFVEDGKAKVRVLAAHQFLPYSDDPINPLKMTVFIKVLGKDFVTDSRVIDADGRDIRTDDRITEVDILGLYSDDEILVIDSNGTIRGDKMAEFGLESSVNPYGVIPFEYINTSKFELVPPPNQEGLDISILIPKLLTDLNYAAQYMSHSIIWTKNAHLQGAEINPDAIVNLGETDADGNSPEIGTIDPKTDIELVLQLIEFEMSTYFTSIGIKGVTVGQMMPGREASGFAKAMDEGDVSQVRRSQAQMFRDVERSLWSKLTEMQMYWSELRAVEDIRKFSPNFVSTFNVLYPEAKPLKTDRQKIEEIKLMRDIGLISKRQSIKQLRPDMTDAQVDEWLEELEEEAAEVMESMLEAGDAMAEEANTSRDEGMATDGEDMGRADNGGNNGGKNGKN